MYSGNLDEEGERMGSTCSFGGLFDCLRPQKVSYNARNSMLRPGVEREMGIMYQQPHLVAPMKLTVFDMIPPPTPPPSGPTGFQWVAQTKSLASRASSRATGLAQTKSSCRPTISDPQPVVLRRRSAGRAEFRPLELSIYLPNNRLSDLPAFDRLAFSEMGDIQLPPKALLRTTSEQILPAPQVVETSTLPKYTSMFESRRPQMHGNAPSYSIYNARSQSEYDPLHSHPVSWCDMPGMGPQISMATEPKTAAARTVLDPMEEEDSSESVVTVEDQSPSRESYITLATSPSVLASEETNRKSSDIDEQVEIGFRANNHDQRQKRVSQWLGHRATLSSTSSAKTTMSSASTTLSFAEHCRKRAQFYQLSANYAMRPPTPPPKPVAPPFHHEQDQDHHQRSMTVSTMQSSSPDTTDRVSLAFDDIDDDDDDDMDSMTTGRTASEAAQSRAGTIRSAPAGVKQSVLPIIVSGIPEVPAGYVIDGDNKAEQMGTGTGMYTAGIGMDGTEINGAAMQVPIGIAF